MNLSGITTALGALALLAGASTMAATPAGQTIAGLEDRADQLQARALATKGYPQHRLLMRRLRLEELIDRLNAGERVDPDEVDALLNQTPPN